MRFSNIIIILVVASFVRMASAQEVTGFTLIDAAADAPVAGFDPISNNAVIDISGMDASRLNIIANTSGTIGSVVFGYDGNASYHTEGLAPYAIGGDDGAGDYDDWILATGSHTLTATPYSEAKGGGTAGTALTITFTVSEGGGSTGGDPVVSAGSDKAVILPASSVTLSGSASDAGGSIAGYSWTKESGPAVTLSGQTTATLSVSGLVEGTYVFRLTVTDNEGNTAYDDVSVSVYAPGSGEGTVTGTLRMWGTVTVSFDGPASSETASPNPFLDYRMQVLFSGPSGQSYNVPGFFDGDGNGNGTGNVWRARFTPDQAGSWSYVASFRSGTDVAISLSASAGSATSFDGQGGTFSVAALSAGAPGNQALGRLEYVDDYYLKYRSGSYYIKGGADSPENFLAYAGFDNTPSSRYTLHQFAPHVSDWNTGDPDWNSGAGRGIIGAVNYLAEHNVNSVYVMPMNIGGDGRDCWPFAGSIAPGGSASNDNTHYDISKLTQWETVFAHMDNKGMLIHMVFNEAETANKNELDNAALGTERKLYYREMVARFGHHLAIQWNLCEEYNLGLAVAPSMILSWADYVDAVDPYDHPIAVHHSHGVDASFNPFLGTRIDMMSIQLNDADFGSVTETWRARSNAAGKRWPVMFDEFDRLGEVDNETHSGSWPNLSGHSYVRKHILWPVLLSGGGVEYILQDLLDTEDFSQYEEMWDYTWYARKFMEENLPFWDMEPYDDLVTGENTGRGGAQVFAKTGEVYAVYLPDASTTGSISLAGGTYTKKWYNPRTGAFAGSGTSVTGGSSVAIGAAPSSTGEDWAVLFTAEGLGSNPTVHAGDDKELMLPANSTSLAGTAGDVGGSITSYAWTKQSGPAATMSGQTTATLSLSDLVEGTYVFRLTVTDNESNTAYDEVTVLVVPEGQASTGAFMEQDGLVVIEMESVFPGSGWIKETAIDGYTGSGYYTYNVGSPTSLQPAGTGLMEYRIKITNPGTYNFRWRNYHNYPADQTLENDSWIKMDGGTWYKCYQTSGTNGRWSFKTQIESAPEVYEYPSYDLDAGYHTFYVSGRSFRHSIDRMHFYLNSVSSPEDPTLPESPREGSGTSSVLLQPQVHERGAGLVCFPNPVTGSAVISVGNVSGPVTAEVYGKDGQLIGSLDMEHTGTAATCRWNASNLAAGTYFVRVRSGNADLVTRIMKMK